MSQGKLKIFVDLWEKAETSQPEIRGSNTGKFLGLSDSFFRLLMENNSKRMNQKLEKLLLRPYRLLGEDDRITRFTQWTSLLRDKKPFKRKIKETHFRHQLTNENVLCRKMVLEVDKFVRLKNPLSFTQSFWEKRLLTDDKKGPILKKIELLAVPADKVNELCVMMNTTNQFRGLHKFTKRTPMHPLLCMPDDLNYFCLYILKWCRELLLKLRVWYQEKKLKLLSLRRMSKLYE